MVKWYWSAGTLFWQLSIHQNIDVRALDVQFLHYQFSCAPELAKKYEIEHCSRSSKKINWSADSIQINHVTSMSWHMCPRMVLGYWSVVILFWQLSIDHIVNVLYKRCGLAKTRLRHPSLPFDSLPYPTRTICRRVGTYARLITWQQNEKKLTIFLGARGIPAKNYGFWQRKCLPGV